MTTHVCVQSDLIDTGYEYAAIAVLYKRACVNVPLQVRKLDVVSINNSECKLLIVQCNCIKLAQHAVYVSLATTKRHG